MSLEEMNKEAPEAAPKKGGLEDAHYGDWHKKMLEDLDLGQHQEMFELIKKVVNEKKEIFLEGDADFKLQFEHFEREMEANGSLSGDEYYKFLNHLVEPFWTKVGEAGPDQISDTNFSALESML